MPALLSGCAAICASVAVERLGGRKGGAIATVPSIVVPAAFGFFAIAPGEQFVKSMAMLSVGMLLSAGFLMVWRILPPRLHALTPTARLLIVATASSAVWIGCAGGVVALERTLALSAGMTLVCGVVAFCALVVLGLLLWDNKSAAPRGTRKVGVIALMMRGLIAAVVVAGALMIAKTGSPVIGGIASAFPVIFLITMVSTWLAHGPEVPAGAIAPMIAGSASVSLFALLAIWLFPLYGPILGLILAWALAVAFVTAPLLYRASLER